MRELDTLAIKLEVKPETIRRLIAGGVREEDVEDVLEMRQRLSDFETEIKSIGEPLKIGAEVSVEAMIKAYKAVDGDIELLGLLVDKAEEIASEIASQFEGAGRNRSKFVNLYRGRFTVAMNEVVKGFQENYSFLEEE